VFFTLSHKHAALKHWLFIFYRKATKLGFKVWRPPLAPNNTQLISHIYKERKEQKNGLKEEKWVFFSVCK
jgi:hypothetical protein